MTPAIDAIAGQAAVLADAIDDAAGAAPDLTTRERPEQWLADPLRVERQGEQAESSPALAAMITWARRPAGTVTSHALIDLPRRAPSLELRRR